MGMPPPIDLRIRTQNPRDYTVQIRHAQTGAIVGTGVVISPNKIVTCAHVVVAAGVNPRKDKPIAKSWAQFLETILHREPETPSEQVGVYFPQVRTDEKKERHAQVAAYFADYDDDIVLLQLIGEAAPLGPEQIATLGTAETSEGNPFRSYGYRRLDAYVAGLADGRIQGAVESRVDRTVLAEPIQLDSNQINRGMSGAGVLDTTRNLVIGIISDAWLPTVLSTRDTGTSWAVNARVLTFPPFGLEVRDESLPLRAAPQPKTDAAEARTAVAPLNRFAWNSAPAVLDEWTGRDDLLKQITQDWLDPQKHVTGLIGFGGEGKSSLARKWVDGICRDVLSNVPTGVFWWGFYENRSVDEFLEAALKWMSGGRIDPRAVSSSSVRAQIIGAMLGAGRYLFVLDGLEVMQHQEGDRFGLLQSNDLRDLLTYFARPDNQSFLLVTSRAPLLDLMEYTTYTHRDVDRLSAADGRALLRKLGVQGKDDVLDKLVADWDGHALTLSLLSAILTEQYGGDVAHVADLPAPTMNEEPVLSGVEGRYERVHRVLRRYDEHLTDAEREFLKLFSAFRTPVRESAFEKVFLPLISKSQKPKSRLFGIGKLGFGISEIKAVVERLVTYRILRFDAHDRTYTTHPLIRNHYLALLTKGDAALEKAAHEQIKDYYLSIAVDTLHPTLDDLKPLIEVVHHACQAGAYDEGYSILIERIYKGYESRVLVNQLDAWETALALMLEFFPDGDISREPQVIEPSNKHWTLNEIGLCLMSLGRLREAVPFYERAIAGYLDGKHWSNVSAGYQNLASLHVYLGTLEASAYAAAQAIDLARRAEVKQDEMVSLALQGTVASLRGEVNLSNGAFGRAEPLAKQLRATRYLWSNIGIFQADHLRRTSNAGYARRVTKANLKFLEMMHAISQISQCHRVLGDLDSDSGNHASARAHYDTALKIARSISKRDVLIEALLARGRWAAKYMKDATSAFSDLNEALGYAVDGGYRIYEADIRVALAWAWLATPIPSPSPVEHPSTPLRSAQDADRGREQARLEAERALRMSEEMGYYWGKVDAEEVLKEISKQ